MDWKWTVTAVLPVISLVLGAVLTQLNDGRRDKAQLARELKAHALERSRQREDRKEEFELKHLTELNTAVTALVGVAMSYAISKAQNPSVQVPAEFYEHNGTVSSLGPMILDERTRRDVRELQGSAISVVASPVSEHGTPRPEIFELGEEMARVSELIAGRMRRIYEEQ
ncbi:hypothetical protein AB0D09_02745 [Streptomyces sp. NPDC049097]|uniref:hypothetical protein n=1 Tax=Streptomyces sp. NPDC049097 TaxID=3155497 RepID=UPI003420E66A